MATIINRIENYTIAHYGFESAHPAHIPRDRSSSQNVQN